MQKCIGIFSRSGNFAGIFQFTEQRAQEFCANAKPKSLVDISAITSIYRPGPLSANVHEQYIQAKSMPHEVDYLNEHVKDVTQETYGFLIFQEQIALSGAQAREELESRRGQHAPKGVDEEGHR